MIHVQTLKIEVGTVHMIDCLPQKRMMKWFSNMDLSMVSAAEIASAGSRLDSWLPSCPNCAPLALCSPDVLIQRPGADSSSVVLGMGRCWRSRRTGR